MDNTTFHTCQNSSLFSRPRNILCTSGNGVFLGECRRWRTGVWLTSQGGVLAPPWLLNLPIYTIGCGFARLDSPHDAANIKHKGKGERTTTPPGEWTVTAVTEFSLSRLHPLFPPLHPATLTRFNPYYKIHTRAKRDASKQIINFNNSEIGLNFCVMFLTKPRDI